MRAASTCSIMCCLCPADKDLFSEFYRKKLARRLLHATSGALGAVWFGGEMGSAYGRACLSRGDVCCPGSIS